MGIFLMRSVLFLVFAVVSISIARGCSFTFLINKEFHNEMLQGFV